MSRPLPFLGLSVCVVLAASACRERTAGSAKDTARDTAIRTASAQPSTPPPAWGADAARVLERQLQRERFNAKDTGYVTGARDCDEGAEEEPPPGLALVAASLASNAVTATDDSNAVRVRTLLTSVARTRHHENGDQEDVDVDVGVKADTVDIRVERQNGAYAICYNLLFLHRGHLDWPVVRVWNPPNASWSVVTRLADSVDAAHR